MGRHGSLWTNHAVDPARIERDELFDPLARGVQPRVDGADRQAQERNLLRTGCSFERWWMSLRARSFALVRSPRLRDVLGDECRVPSVGHQLCAGRVRVNPVAGVLGIWKVRGTTPTGTQTQHCQEDERTERELLDQPGAIPRRSSHHPDKGGDSAKPSRIRGMSGFGK